MDIEILSNAGYRSGSSTTVSHAVVFMSRTGGGIGIPWYKNENYYYKMYEEPLFLALKEVPFVVTYIKRAGIYQLNKVTPLIEEEPDRFGIFYLPNVGRTGTCMPKSSFSHKDLNEVIKFAVNRFWASPFGPHHLWYLKEGGSARFLKDMGSAVTSDIMKDPRSEMFVNLIRRSERGKKPVVNFLKRYTMYGIPPASFAQDIGGMVATGLDSMKNVEVKNEPI